MVPCWFYFFPSGSFGPNEVKFHCFGSFGTTQQRGQNKTEESSDFKVKQAALAYLPNLPEGSLKFYMFRVTCSRLTCSAHSCWKQQYVQINMLLSSVAHIFAKMQYRMVQRQICLGIYMASSSQYQTTYVQYQFTANTGGKIVDQRRSLWIKIQDDFFSNLQSKMTSLRC